MSFSDDKTNAKLNALEKRLSREYRKAYVEMKASADKYFDDFKDRYEREYIKYQQGMYTDLQFKSWVQTQLARGIGWDKLKNNMAERMTMTNEIASQYINADTPSIFALNQNYEAYMIHKTTGQNIAFDLYDENTVKNLMTESGNFTDFKTVSINPVRDYAWNRKQIESALVSGIMQGKPIDKIANSFETVMQRNKTSAIRNARTAVTSAQNAGRINSMKQAQKKGINVQKRWISAHDGRVRDSHAHLDGQIRNIDDYFDNGLLFPADSDGAPAEVYNCRCTLTYIYPEYDGHIESNETYKEWIDNEKKERKSNHIPMNLQFFSYDASDYDTIHLDKQEYAHVMSELSTHLTKEQKKKKVVSKAIGNKMYMVENLGDEEYRIIGVEDIT